MKMCFIFAIVLMGGGTSIMFAQSAKPTVKFSAALRAELAKMVEEDQRLRSVANPTYEEWEQIERVDRTNTKRMKEIIAEHGWPGRSLIGEVGRLQCVAASAAQ
jgi:hypothetical protein